MSIIKRKLIFFVILIIGGAIILTHVNSYVNELKRMADIGKLCELNHGDIIEIEIDSVTEEFGDY